LFDIRCSKILTEFATWDPGRCQGIVKESLVSSSLGSIFEIYKIGRGPSSSHSIGPQRAAERFLAKVGVTPERIRVTLYGSLAATGRGHGTDRVVAGALQPIPVDFVWETQARSLPHPNTLRFEALDRVGGCLHEWTVWSVGGGNLRDAEGAVSPSAPVQYAGHTIREALSECQRRRGAYWQLVEAAEADVWQRLEVIWDAMCRCVRRGLDSDEVDLPGELHVQRKAGACHGSAQTLASPQRDLALLGSFALAVAEENAAGGEIVTAPSCGAAGVLPAVLFYLVEVDGLPRDNILRALATAGLFGAVIRANASISGAEVGCQGEIGSACSMAAAAAAQLQGGTLQQIEYAAEIAMEHHLGLTCDPVEGYVQIPCIERNMTAALRAYEAATFAMLTDGRHLISFDAVIQAMYETGRDLREAYRETARGGLAHVWHQRVASVRGEGTAACD
jgi:L-serine dehydratase